MLLENLIYLLIAFTVILLVYILVINKARKQKSTGSMEYGYLLKRFKLENTKENTLRWIVSITNSFIIAFTSVVVFNIDNWILKILVGFVILMTLIYSLYEIIGRILKRKESRK
jgi:putative exporter of polyketide antibiotics